MIRRLFIANRGEIACRIARTCHRLDIAAVGVYSRADVRARHPRWLDEALPLVGDDPVAAYLDAAALIALARQAGCDAVHPGYGFLAENAGFARAVVEAGLVFVGPTADAIAAMGDKHRARAIARAAGVPVLPGTRLAPGAEAEAAATLGYPLLLKPAAGGGGKGMVVVEAATDLAAAVAAARRTAKAAFADDALIAEAWLEACRHVEVQVIADHHGRIVTAFERDCSLQRRHQKIVEEAPAPGLAPALRERLAADAIAVAAATGYRNLGTVEFLVSGDRHVFIEMNTRLQVEHPVTEAVTGLDLVEWQLRIADGEAVPADLVPAAPVGHAIEARLCAEDASTGFLPSPGRLHRLELPADRLRVDAGVDEGDDVTAHFDPLIAKLVGHGVTREAARQQLLAALEATVVRGVRTNLDLLCQVLADPEVTLGPPDTTWLGRRSAPTWNFPLPAAELAALVLARAPAVTAERAATGWASGGGFRLNAAAVRRCRLLQQGRLIEPALVLDFPFDLARGRGWIELEGVRHGFGYRLDEDAVTVTAGGRSQSFRLAAAVDERASAAAAGHLATPMPGRITALPAIPGGVVRAGELLAVVEAMKMEHPIRAPVDGRIVALHVALGQQVAEGVVVCDLEPAAGR